MSTKEQVLEILKVVKPNKDLAEVTDIVEGGYIDSMELLLFISTLCDTFGIEIGIEEIVPENFNSVDQMVAMVERLQG